MESLPKDLIMTIALEYNLPDILSTCLTSKRMRDIICDNETFWMNKVKRDYPEMFNNVVNKEKGDNFSWKQLYNRRYNVDNGKTRFAILFQYSAQPTMQLNRLAWRNPSGMEHNTMQGWSLYKDKISSNIVYLRPTTYFSLYGPNPKEGENHPIDIIRIEFSPKPIISKIPWNESLFGNEIHFKRGDGKVYWYDDFYMYRFEFDGVKFDFKSYIVN